ncbi:MAG: hypothetical protein A2Y25_11920 [Candidatus Melainabacteria bacterium GWF2_37_15]|nr:MAG: hypothetical protein A2Y25_11920 [Candidatus Melainabacteria bacterium GWF2_37_15]
MKEFKRKIQEITSIPTENITFFWKGRVALYAILKAIGIQEGDEVIVPAFTCVVVPNAIIYLDAKPVYVDIDLETYNIDVNKIEEKITSKTRAILAQNIFGMSSDLDSIMQIAEKHNLYVIEDCAHGFGGYYKGRPNGSVADAAFYSTQWNKPFSTGLGGIAVTKNDKIAEKLRKIETQAIPPAIKDVWSLGFLLLFRDIFMSSCTYWLITNIYRFLSKYNLILGSSQGEEIEKPVMPHDFLKGFSNLQAKRGIKELKNLPDRRKIAELYAKKLNMPFYPEHNYLRFPVLVKNKTAFLKKAQKHQMEIGDWFLSPLHPVTSNYELWNYNYGEYPNAEYTAAHIVNLPTHSRINENLINKLCTFVKDNKNL